MTISLPTAYRVLCAKSRMNMAMSCYRRHWSTWAIGRRSCCDRTVEGSFLTRGGFTLGATRSSSEFLMHVYTIYLVRNTLGSDFCHSICTHFRDIQPPTQPHFASSNHSSHPPPTSIGNKSIATYRPRHFLADKWARSSHILCLYPSSAQEILQV
jgi:hypothetical protein